MLDRRNSMLPALLAGFERVDSLEAALTQSLHHLLRVSGARAGALAFSPSGIPPCTVTAGRRLAAPLDAWLRERVTRPLGPARASVARTRPPGWKASERLVIVEAPVGTKSRRVGRLLLLGLKGPGRQGRLPSNVPRELGLALEQIWRQRGETLKSSGELATLVEERVRRARQTQALLDAARAVSRSLEVGETIRVILDRAQEVLGVASCGLMTLDHPTGELRSVASLDLTEEVLGRIRVKVGEGITGLAVKERRPVQSEDIYRDARVLYPALPKETGLRSMLAVPLVVGQRVVGALTVFRSDVHRFTEDEERLLSAFADQAAIALDHARLYSSVRTYSEQLESMVTERTSELNEQKRFVEVVLETLPLGLYVLDDQLNVVTANREGTRVLSRQNGRGRSFLSLVPDDNRGQFQQFLEEVFVSRKTHQVEEELELNGQSTTLRLTAAPLESVGSATHLVLIIEDITLQKRLARQMLLTERLSTAGRLAAGVAHELNNPLATIAGCAEALKERARAPELTTLPGFQDFPPYLGLIEEEAYRCKEITGSLLHFVRDPGSRRAPTDVNALVGKTLDLLQHQARFSEAQFLTELDTTLPSVLANEGQLRQVFLGLASNALEAMEGTGCLTVRSRRLPGNEIEVEFEDTGPGISEEALSRIFDPFFTTKPPGQGTGLGLAIAQGIVTDHGGRIEAMSRTGQGTRFQVILPLMAEGEGR